MAPISKKSIVPQELILDGSTNPFFIVKNAAGQEVFTILGNGDITMAQGASETALTAALVDQTTFTHQAPAGNDYLIANPVQNSGFGFSTANEMNSTLAILRNAVLRIAEIEAALEAKGIVAAN